MLQLIQWDPTTLNYFDLIWTLQVEVPNKPTVKNLYSRDVEYVGSNCYTMLNFDKNVTFIVLMSVEMFSD